MSGRPTVCILLREEHIRDVNFREMLDLLSQFKKGILDSGLKIKTGRLQNLISSSCIEHLDFLHLLPSDALPKLESFRQLEHTINVGYQSLTDIPKAVIYTEPTDVDYFELYKGRYKDTTELLKYLCIFFYIQTVLHGQI